MKPNKTYFCPGKLWCIRTSGCTRDITIYNGFKQMPRWNVAVFGSDGLLHPYTQLHYSKTWGGANMPSCLARL